MKPSVRIDQITQKLVDDCHLAPTGDIVMLFYIEAMQKYLDEQYEEGVK